MPLALVDAIFPLIAALGLAMARMTGVVLVLPVFTRLGMTGIVRSGIAFAFSIPVMPHMLTAFGGTLPGVFELTGLIVKELFLGVLLGVLFAVPFWGAETAGNIIDQQRGASSTFLGDPSGMEEASVLGTLFALVLISLFVIAGGFDLVVGGVYDSYRLWPVERFLPPLTPAGAEVAIGLIDRVTQLGVLLAAPIVIAMFLGDLALGLVNRFAQQLNVFNIGFAVKSLIMVLLLPLYAVMLIQQFGSVLAPLRTVLATLAAYLK
jgi:type III secretion protein T